MSFHMLAYEELTAQGATNEDLDALVDPIFSTRNSHYIFSENYNLLAAFACGGDMTDVRFNIPSINTVGRHHVWPVERSTTIPDYPRIQDLRDFPLPLPVREELAIESSNNDGAATDQANVFLWIAPPGWNLNIPRGIQRITIAATGAVAGVAQAWSAAGAITFAENLRGGYYSIIGAQCFDAGTLALRFVFPRGNEVNGRQLRPGILCTEAIGNSPLEENMGGFGVLGSFDTDEPPQIEIYANASAASAQVLRIDLVYHGNSKPAGYH